MRLTDNETNDIAILLKSGDTKALAFIEMLQIFKERINETIDTHLQEYVESFMTAPIAKMDYTEFGDEELTMVIQHSYFQIEEGMLNLELPKRFGILR